MLLMVYETLSLFVRTMGIAVVAGVPWLTVPKS